LRLPRDISGEDLIQALSRFGFERVRQDGSHVRLTSLMMGSPCHVSVPLHRSLKVGTLGGIVTGVARYLDRDRDEIAEELFGR